LYANQPYIPRIDPLNVSRFVEPAQENDLERILCRNVDLVLRDAVKAQLRELIAAEAINAL